MNKASNPRVLTGEFLDKPLGYHLKPSEPKEYKGGWRSRLRALVLNADGDPEVKEIERTARTPVELDQAMDKLKAELKDKYGAGAAAMSEGRCLTVNECVDSYMKMIAKIKRTRTVKSYQSSANGVKTLIGTMLLDHLKSQMIIENDKLWVRGSVRSHKRIELLKRAVDYALASDAWASRTGKNPLTIVPSPLSGVEPEDRVNAQPKRPVSDDETIALLASVKDSPQWHAFYYVCLHSGPRTDEVLKLKRTDYNPQFGTLHVHKSSARGLKTRKSARFIFLDQEGKDRIEALIKAQDEAGYNGEWLFPALEGGPYSEQNFGKQEFKPRLLTLKLAQIAPKGGACRANPDRTRKHDQIATDFSLVGFRHRAFTHWRAVLGDSPGFINAQLGHSGGEARLNDMAVFRLPYFHGESQTVAGYRQRFAQEVGNELKPILAKVAKAHLTPVPGLKDAA